MTAGRALDALIATKVMHDIPGQALGPRHYSTDIAAAWEVVEKLRTLAFVSIGTANGELMPNGLPERLWVCTLSCLGDDVHSHIEGEADTAPLAICRASLKACERR